MLLPHRLAVGVIAVRRRGLRFLRLSRRQRLGIWLTLVVTVMGALAYAAMVQMKPILTNLATTRVSNTVNRIVVAAVNDAVENNEINYDTLINFEKDAEGKVTALRSNMGEFNRLQAKIADDILVRLSDVSTSELSIPVGTLTGSSLFAGRGPSIVIKMQSVGSTTAHLRNAFTSAGINQTKHQILLDVDVYVSILLPGFRTSTKVSNEISVAETVIVGSVPQTYTYFGTTDDELEDMGKEYILNNG
ncbi:MAG: sporulation protein YunB [Clostridiales bacterium]|nr:sporulation protein YunB [Clostridiales bacterium]